MFFYKYLRKEHLEGFDNYKYMAIDTSPLSVYVMHPFWNKVVEFVPRWVAPNLLTFLGFLLTVLDFVLLSYYDYSYTAASARNETIVELSERPEVIPQTLWYALAVFLFLAYTLDGIDGKQARRTQTSGPLGELFDHGLDSYSVFFIPACLHWEKYNTGVLFLPWGYDFSMWGTAWYKRYLFDGYTLANGFEWLIYATGVLTNLPILQARNGQDAYHVGSAPAAVVSAVGVRASAAVGLALPHHEVTAFYGIVTLSVLAHIHYGACVVQQMCEHFRISCFHIKKRVSAIIDVDIVPETCRRVKLLKHGSDRPLGFFIRDGTSVRVTPNGVERSPGIFISRLVPGGLAESTGLLGVNDEVLEVNGIDVSNKTLDQVTDMMVANSSNLIITVRPANQRAGPPPVDAARNSQPSSEPDEDRFDQDEQDEIVDLTAVTLEDQPEPAFQVPSKDDGQVLHL
ncbi:hypothetical protein MSG28_013819 [Choristoneura fumiferana]|uniref:Uncharacterized protein n=2 Tax=Choristoneura fumiferana TaxID=7141 RepID=A0ACC0K904_CHOFU|nr:hypothetical protein MSG28_013819 [Choristoneura fumiferana]KAI8432899.1 hypothetical protein MSG28_013819 [Choristoneura fumiferana]